MNVLKHIGNLHCSKDELNISAKQYTAVLLKSSSSALLQSLGMSMGDQPCPFPLNKR